MFEFIESREDLEKIYYELHKKFDTEKEENIDWRGRGLQRV